MDDAFEEKPRTLDIKTLLKTNGKYQAIWEGTRSTFRLGTGTLKVDPQKVTDMTTAMIACVLNEFHNFLEAIGSDRLTEDQIDGATLRLLDDIRNSLAERIKQRMEGTTEEDDDNDSEAQNNGPEREPD